MHHAHENELNSYALTEELGARFHLVSIKRTKLYIRLTNDHVMELRPTDMLDDEVPTWYWEVHQVNKGTGEHRTRKTFRANVVVRRALPEDSTVVFSHTLMAPNIQAIIELALKCANAKTELSLAILKARSTRTKKD